MFFTLVLCSMLGYSIQGTLLVKLARSMDQLSLGMYRTLSLGLTMSPLLLLVKDEDFARFPSFLPLMTLSALLGALAQWTANKSLAFLPVGVSTALRSGGTGIMLVIWGMIFFGETLSVPQLFFIGIILGGGVLLSLSKNPMDHLDGRTLLGAWFCALTAVMASGSFFLMSKIARELSPYLSAYAWETMIGVMSFLVGLSRQSLGGRSLQKVTLKRFGSITLMSAPTLIGTGCFAYAVTIGPISIASAVGTGGGILVSTILAYLWYHEKLKSIQWILIAWIIAGIVGMKFVGF